MKRVVTKGVKEAEAKVVEGESLEGAAGAEYASDEERYQRILQQRKDREAEELEKIREIKAAQSAAQSIERLVPVEAMLKDAVARPITEIPEIAEKIHGFNPGYIARTQLREVGVRRKDGSSVRDEVLQVPDRLKMDETHMVKLAKPTLLSKDPTQWVDDDLHSIYDSVREYISGPLYNILLPGASPKIGIIHNTHSDTISPDGSRHLPAGARRTPDGSMRISSKFMPAFTTLDDASVKRYVTHFSRSAPVQGRFPTPISGFEKVVVASIMIGEADPNPGNIGFIKEVRPDASRSDAAPVEEFSAAKIDHGRSLISTPQNMMELLHNLEWAFFSSDGMGNNYTHYIDDGILTFDLKVFKEEIDLACSKLNREEVESIIGARIDALEKAGVDFKLLLTLHKDSFCHIMYWPSDKNSLKEPTKQGLIDYYVNNIMTKKALMQELSVNIGEILEREGASYLRPQRMISLLRAKELERERRSKMVVEDATLSDMSGAAGLDKSAGYAAASAAAAQPRVLLAHKGIDEAETLMVSTVADLIALDLFQSGAKGMRREDAERIKNHLISVFAELKELGHDIKLSAEQMGRLVGQHRSAFKSKWARRVDPKPLAQCYYDASLYTAAGNITGGIHMPADPLKSLLLRFEIKFNIKNFITSEASKGPGRS